MSVVYSTLLLQIFLVCKECFLGSGFCLHWSGSWRILIASEIGRQPYFHEHSVLYSCAVHVPSVPFREIVSVPRSVPVRSVLLNSEALQIKKAATYSC